MPISSTASTSRRLVTSKTGTATGNTFSQTTPSSVQYYSSTTVQPWYQAIASTGVDIYLMGINHYDFQFTSGSAGYFASVEFGVGAAGAEVVRGSVVWNLVNYYNRITSMLPVPLFIPAGSRISVRGFNNYSGSYTMNLSLIWVNVSDLE